MLIDQGDDFGWPYCYFSTEAESPGPRPRVWRGRQEGRSLRHDEGTGHGLPGTLGAAGACVLHRLGAEGSYAAGLHRVPRVVEPRAAAAGRAIAWSSCLSTNGKPTGSYTTFATGTESDTWLRASGVAVAPDGAVYISADKNGHDLEDREDVRTAGVRT